MLRIRSLGTVPYHEAYALQHALAAEAEDDYLLILQHPHTYTLGAHADDSHVLVDPASVGAVLERTDRGGDVTYHGPGQLVAYPIVTVPDDPSSGPAHVHRLEQVVTETLADLGLVGTTERGRVSRRVGGRRRARPRKIAAIGVRTMRVSDGRRRTLHGVALNVTSDLSMFGHIVPCGIADRGVTSLRAEGVDVTMAAVVEAFVARASAAFESGQVERADVMTGVATRRGGAAVDGDGDGDVERPLLRRLRQAGVAPEAGLDIAQRKPPWVRVPVRLGTGYRKLGSTIHDLGLVTVCEEAGCPNIYECWSDGTATFMINGERCTRACGFCQVDTRHPLPLSPDEPGRVAEAVARMGLGHAVVTCVARDDLTDGGAGAMAATIWSHPGAHPGHDGRGAHFGLPGRPRVTRPDLRGASGRAEPQHRDGGPAAAGRAALGGLRPQPGCAGPGVRRGAGDQVGPDGRAGRARRRGGGHHGRPARRRRFHRDRGAVPSPEPRPPPGVALLGRPRSSTGCARRACRSAWPTSRRRP